MPYTNPPWPPERDGQADAFYARLLGKYPDGIDALGIMRWCSEWRMHLANGMSDQGAWQAISLSIDAIRAGLQPAESSTGQYDVPWPPGLDQDSPRFAVELVELWHDEHPESVARKRQVPPQPPLEVDGRGWTRWSSDYRIHRANGLSHASAFNRIANDVRRIWGLAPPTPTRVHRPIIGPLRVEQKLFRDDTGYRRVFLCSWFPALRILRDDPQEFERQIGAIADAGYHGFRTFLAVGGWMDFWDGREVVPITFQKWHHSRESGMLRPASLGVTLQAWPDYDDLLRTMLRACRARGLRLHLSTGDMQIIAPEATKELDLHRRLARICADEGGLEVIAAAGDTNEYPQNRAGSTSDASIALMGRLLALWRDAIPGVLTGQGAALSEEPDELRKSATHGDVCFVHTTRDPFALCLKRTLGLVYWEGDYRAFPKPFWQGEPAGPGRDVFAALDDPASLTALYAMHALTGQASNYFNGPAVRSREPLETTWGFRELPRILNVLPDDIATWNHGSNRHGGIEYWWRGDQFATATFKEWDSTPPRPIVEWTLYAGDVVTRGIGTPPKGTGLLVGRFSSSTT